jgi:hypothetical protein
MYSIITKANWPIKSYCNSERYWALAMKHLSLTDGCTVRSLLPDYDGYPAQAAARRDILSRCEAPELIGHVMRPDP